MVHLAVRDEGPGIPEEHRGKLFEKFARFGTKATGGEKSTGLGLAITHRIVNAHGGKIDVHSNKGEGSTFTVTLPRWNGHTTA
jgi:signal transduction histidine kinase